MPATIFTKNIEEIDKFIKKHKKLLLSLHMVMEAKIFFLLIRRLKKKKILSYINKHDQVMVQKFLPKIKRRR